MGNEILEKKIDDNKNNLIEDKELLKFIGNQKNTEELGNYLNTMTFKDRGDKLYRATQEQIEKNTFSISQKVKEFKPLSIDDQNIMKLQYFIDNRNYPQSEVIFNLYLGTKFNNQQYGSKISFIKQESPLMANQKENRELSAGEKRLQMETILETGQCYIQFLQNKGIFQPQYEGDKTQQSIYLDELQSKYANGEVLRDEEVLSYIHQIFRDISVSGVGYSSKTGDAYKQIDKIFTSKDSWNPKNIEKKKIEVLYQIRQIDDAKGIYYKSSDILLSTLSTSLGSCRVNRGPEPGKLNNALMQFNFFKPLENGNFSDPDISKMYTKLKNPSSDILIFKNVTKDKEKNEYINEGYGDSSIFSVFKKYKLPFEGASNQDMYDLQKKLVSEISPLKQKEIQQKSDIKKSITDVKTKEIKIQNEQKEILKKDFQNQNSDLQNPIFQQTLAYFDQQIIMNQKLIKGEPIEMETPDGGKKSITLDMIVAEQYQAMETKLMSDIVQKGIIYEVLNQNKKTTNFIRDIKNSGTKLTSDEKAIDMLADITGAGDYRSDKTFNTTVDVTKELVIQVALMAISGGIANMAAKGTLMAIQGGAEFFEAGTYAARVANYVNMSKTAFWSSVRLMPELFAADIIAEGSIFHRANTTLNAPLQGLTTEEYLKRINPFGSYQEQQADGTIKDVSSAMGYVESVAFMGVMKGFGSVTNQITTVLGGKTLNIAQQSKKIKNILTENALTLPGEILGMQATSASISLAFGRDVDLTPQSRAHTLALVLGLRIAHMGTAPIKGVTEKMEGKIQQASMKQGTIEIVNIIPGKEPGSVKAVEYRVLDAKGKEMDHGIASKETIDAALKSKKQSETNPEKTKNKLNISPEIQEKNSLNSDKLINSDLTINAEAKSSVEQYLREQKVLGETEKLSDAQIRKIYEVHNMEKKPGETEAQLNNRKGIVLRELFTAEQIRALLEGKVCGVTEKISDRGSLNIEKKDTENLLPNEFLDYMISTQKRFLETKIKRNPDIKVTDNVSFEENITLVNHNDMSLVNPPKKIIKIEINTTLDQFADQYNQAIKDKIGDLGAETAYSIYDFNQDIYFQAPGAKEAKNESGWRNYMSNGKLLRREEATNNNKSSTEKTQQTQKNPETSKNQLNIPLEVQKQNSLNSDKILNSDLTINAEAKSSVEQYLREQKVLGETEKLSDAQIRKIYEVHNMEKRPGETEVQLNNRKGIVLRELFTAEQIRALMEGKVCGVTQEATTSDVIKVIEERGIGEDPRLPNSFLNAIGVKKGNINSEQLGMIGVLWSRLNNKKSGEVREIFKSISVETRELLNTHNIDLTYIISDTGKSSNIKRLWNTDIGMLKKCINESGVSVLDRDGILKLSDFLMKEELQKCKTIEDVKNVFIKFPSYEFSEADLPLDNKFKPQMKDNLFYKGTEEIFNEIIKYGITPLEWKALSRHKRLGKTSNMYNETQKIEDKYTNTIMNDALKKIPSEKGIFYRGIHISPSKFEAQIVEENGKKIWKDKGYTGSSLTQTMGEFYSGGQILLTIEGKNAKTIEKFWENEELGEAEYLFASGTPFEVVEIQRNVIGTDGKNIEMVVKLKEIDNSKTDHK